MAVEVVAEEGDGEGEGAVARAINHPLLDEGAAARTERAHIDMEPGGDLRNLGGGSGYLGHREDKLLFSVGHPLHPDAEEALIEPLQDFGRYRFNRFGEDWRSVNGVSELIAPRLQEVGIALGLGVDARGRLIGQFHLSLGEGLTNGLSRVFGRKCADSLKVN